MHTGGDDDFLHHAVQVGPRFLRLGKAPCSLDDDLRSRLLPGNATGIGRREDRDALPIDHPIASLGFDRAMKATIRRVVAKQMRVRLALSNVVDDGNFRLLRVSLQRGPYALAP